MVMIEKDITHFNKEHDTEFGILTNGKLFLNVFHKCSQI